MTNIISFLNSSKASDPNSIPYRIFFLLKNEISKQLADLFNLSFMTGIFPSLLKTAKVVPVFKKDSKLDYSNYRPISLLSNIEQILEKPMHKKSEWVSEWGRERASERVSEWVSEWVTDWLTDWLTDWRADWLIYLPCDGSRGKTVFPTSFTSRQRDLISNWI